MLLDGRTIANHILENLTTRVKKLEERYGTLPHLAVVKVGNDPATASYIRQKEKMGKQIGAVVSVYQCPLAVTETKLFETINYLQRNGEVHGIILQLPIPQQIDAQKLILQIHPDKDVDGFRPQSQFIVPIAKAVLKLLEVPYEYELRNKNKELRAVQQNPEFFNWLRSKNIVVMGKGKTGGAPIADLLRKDGAKVTVVDSQTSNAEEITKKADILISAVGKRGVITKNMLKKDAILLGVGMGMDTQGNFGGDYMETDIQNQALWYTPVPGGVGPVNVACLMENLVIATENATKN